MQVTEISQQVERIISIAQTLLRGEAEDVRRSPARIREKVTLAAGLFQESLSPEVAEAAVSELIRRFSCWVGAESTLQDRTGHVEWLQADRKQGWRYWPRLQRYMERSLPIDVVDSLDRSTDRVLGLLEDPKRGGAWDRRGLVVGHVQSGKTSNYSALICKAADAGYKVIVVLAGLHKSLRSQTQVRLEEAFLGYETSPNRDPGAPVGVFDEDRDPSIHPHCATTRADNGDFSTAIQKHFAVSPEERPWLFVVKKNKTVLERLLKWMQSNHVADSVDPATGRRVVTKLPLLMIDDEADHASVDTGEQAFDENGNPDDEHQPKAINGLIRRILHTFNKSAYVGYTATPFANIFIHRKNATPLDGPDLFPRSFILNLAAPSNYIGPARVFGQRGPDGRVGGLPLCRVVNDHITEDGSGGWMPQKHDKEHVPVHNGQEAVPPSLRAAIGTFVLACAVRRLRGQGNKHASMLVHVTRFTGVQRQVHHQVEEVIRRMRQHISRRIDHQPILDELRRLWEEDFVPTSSQVADLVGDVLPLQALPSWDEVEQQLPAALTDIQVTMVNGGSKDALAYVEHEATGLKVIAIGGEKLARGLTLEGLCVSYFVRNTRMYDTLMQMGRWFGYRPGYLDLCRLYTPPELVDWFGHITDAAEELREEFDAMAEANATPEQYGMKVASHPVLTVTSPLKMRSAQTLRLSYSGNLVQSVSLRSDRTALASNIDATDRLLAAMPSSPEASPSRNWTAGQSDRWSRSWLWSGAPSDSVVEFLRSFSFPAGVERANPSVIADFIERMNELGELRTWHVALLAEGHEVEGDKFTFASGFAIKAMPSRKDKLVDGRYSIGVLTDPADESICLDAPSWQRALEETKKAWVRDPARGRNTGEPEKPNGPSMRKVRSKAEGGDGAGLLMLYPLNPEVARKSIGAWDRPVMAFAISLPSSDAPVTVEYKVDHLYMEQEYASAV